MTATNINAILFDVDGTLLDSYRLYLESYRRAVQPVLGYAPDDSELIARNPSSEGHFLRAWLGEEVGAVGLEAVQAVGLAVGVVQGGVEGAGGDK